MIELLTVIAIIGILASIVIPAIGKVRENANIVASKANLSGYVNAIGLFKGEYNYYPFPKAHADGGDTIPNIGEAKFVAELSATKLEGGRLTSAEVASNNYGNRNLLSFYDFSESDFKDGDSTSGLIADRFENTNIFIAIDGDGDGIVEGMPDPEGGAVKQIRTKVTAYVQNDTTTPETPDYYLYE